MRSLEIAALTRKQHRNVLADIRHMLGELGLSTANFSAVYTAGNGQHYEVINLPRNLTQTLITGYSTPLRHRVIQRLNELESGMVKSPQALSVTAVIQGWLSSITEQVCHLEEKISEDAGKVSVYDDIVDAGGLFNPGAAAKIVATGRTRMLRYLRLNKILMSGPNKMNMPYQEHLDAGRFEVKLHSYKNPKTGETEVKPLPLFTGKGIIWLQQFITQNGRNGL